MYAVISRIYSAARSRLEALIAALPGSHDDGSRRGSRRRRGRSSATSTPLSSPMSMCSIIGAGDDQATPASSSAAYNTPQGGAAKPVALSPLLLPPPQMVVVALDATRDHRDEEIRIALRGLLARGDILRGGDSLLVLGVLHFVTHPRKYMEANMTSQYDSSARPVLCTGCGLKSVPYIKESMKFPFSEIQAATSTFSKENLLGEGGFGHVYKGQLKDGQVIAAKLRKEASSQGYTEFFSEVQVLSFARHRNIIMLLGYCCKESYNILVYEYICNNSLEWHLFDKSASLLEWHKRHAIAIGIAKGLRFLHEECRAGPIIHRDLRPSNVLLTHDFVPMLGDFGLAKWKAGNGSIQTRILGQSGYLAPEYAEYGIVSVRTDVYAFGIVLFQLISGRKVLDECEGQCTHILQWAEPLVESLALHELIDDCIKDTYDTYGLYHLARAAYLCVRTNPEQRPSMGEVVRLIETENEHIRDLSRQFIPQFTK